ncbi:MAG: carboxylesterase/lipase family protein [Candidatus Heimdallarchaeota archaeon]
MKKTNVINTQSGKIQGYSEDGVEIFMGIPYAEPPVGDLRLNAPVSKEPWNNVLDALEYLPVSPQPPPFTTYFPPPPQSEAECLNLNIWTPGCDDKKRPVMFWIHGGSHIYGSGRILNGRSLPNQGNLVLITINYRLGPLGYLYIPGAPPNIGQIDQIMALTWVHENIELFGGDPNNITIFGESAGATSVSTLMAMPKAKGLFNRAISQSGALQPRAFEKATREKTAELVLAELNLNHDDLEGYRKLPIENIIEGFTKAQGKALLNRVELEFRPYIDGESLPEHPIKAIEKGYAKDIELIVGTNLEEWRFWRAFEPNFEELELTRIKKRIENLLTAIGEDERKIVEIIKTYENSREQINLSINLHEIYEAFMTDYIFRIPSINFAEAQSKHQKNTYVYMFNWKTPFDNGRFGAMHAMEIAFVFGGFWEDYLFTFPKKTDETAALSEKMMNAWASFAKSGNPNHKGLPEWPTYESKKRKTMIFDKNVEVWDDPLGKERELWSQLKMWSHF